MWTQKEWLLHKGVAYYQQEPYSLARKHVLKQVLLYDLDDTWNSKRVRHFFREHKTQILELILKDREEKEAQEVELPSSPRFLEQNRKFHLLEVAFRQTCRENPLWYEAHRGEYVIFTEDAHIYHTYPDWYSAKNAAKDVKTTYFLGPVSETPEDTLTRAKNM